MTDQERITLLRETLTGMRQLALVEVQHDPKRLAWAKAAALAQDTLDKTKVAP